MTVLLDTAGMNFKVGTGTRQASCSLLPPCKQGNHGLCINSEGGEHAVKPIGKYYFTEDALKHDLGALRRGEIYERNEFYKRARAWYKAEVDRLLHLEKVAREKSQTTTTHPTEHTVEPNNETLETNTTSQTPTTQRKDAATPAKIPTRIQPSRAAKRKAAVLTPTTSKRPPRRRMAAPALLQALPPFPMQTQGPQSMDPGPKAETETKGDYTLAAYDWGQLLNSNKGEHHPGPWSYVRLQGLDVAYFGMRLESAVGKKIQQILARDNDEQQPREDSAENRPGEPVVNTDDDEEEEDDISGEQKREKHAPAKTQDPLHAQSHPNDLRCALGRRDQRAAPFQPAAALAPGEDWRPPIGPQAASAQDTTRMQEATTISCSWAADEVGRREEMNRRTGTGQAPEAEMEISPTLGRWRRHSLCKTELEMGLPVEDLGANVVEVSGLKFAVDLCAATFATKALGAEDGVRFLML